MEAKEKVIYKIIFFALYTDNFMEESSVVIPL